MMDKTLYYERIEARCDGYLWLINYPSENKGQEHHQPLLLPTASFLLRQLLETSHGDVITNRHNDTDKEALDEKLDGNIKNQSGSSQLDTSIHNIGNQQLKHVADLDHGIVSMLTDILLYGHNPKLQKTKKNLREDRDNSLSSSAYSTLPHPHIRLVRTLNSIRALVPILLPILYHPHLNQLPKSSKEQVWLKGTFVSVHSTVRIVKKARSHMQYILKLFLPNKIAQEVLQKPLEDWSSFWNQQWLPCVWYFPNSNKTNVAPSPYDALASQQNTASTSSSAYKEAKMRIVQHCHVCDETIWPTLSWSNGRHCSAEAIQTSYPQALPAYNSCLANSFSRFSLISLWKLSL